MAQSLGTRWRKTMWEGRELGIPVCDYQMSSSAQYLGQAWRVSEGGMTSLSFSRSLYAFSNLSHEIPTKIYENSRIVSLALPHLAYFSLSAFLIFICMRCFCRNLFFSVCLLPDLSPAAERVVSRNSENVMYYEQDWLFLKEEEDKWLIERYIWGWENFYWKTW